jgi:ketosteroid isomerase-like protein
MRSWRLYSCVALALPCVAFAQQPTAADKPAPAAGMPASNPVASSPLAKLLEANVRAAWTAFKNKDKDGYAKFLTDDFQAVESDGEGERTKRHVLGEVEHCMYIDYLLQFFQVQPLGPDFAFVTYESSMQFPRGSLVRFRRVFVGELWTRQNGQWKMMRYQETLVR